MAVYILHHLPAIEDAECLPLAKNWLRVAWLHRDLQNNKSLRENYHMVFAKAVEQLKNHWIEGVTTEQAALEKSLSYYAKSIVRSRSVNTTTFEMQIHVMQARILLQLDQFSEAKNHRRNENSGKSDGE